MKISPADIFPQTSGAQPSLEERLADSLAEIARLTELVEVQAKIIAELRQEIVALKQENAALKQENLALRERLNRNSTNSNQPPSQDNPFCPPPKASQQRSGSGAGQEASTPSAGKKSRPYHKGARQQLLKPDRVIPCPPESCSCGCRTFVDLHDLWPHQWIELLAHPVEVVHCQMQAGFCSKCGKLSKGRVPAGYETGYGPSLTALIATLNAGMTVSWRKLADCLRQVFGVPISAGAVGKCLQRAGAAIEPHHEAIAQAVRAAPVNHVDETSWRRHGPLGKKRLWLWVMVNREAALFRVAPSRKAAEFDALRGDWKGILVSDDYQAYVKWPLRQTCLAHLIRRALGLAESADAQTALCGWWGLLELQRLCGMSLETPEKEVALCLARLRRYIERYCGLPKKNKAGAFARCLDKNFDALMLFLRVPGVEPTNNLAERSLRHGVILRKISIGTSSEVGQRWIERALSLSQTCRSQNKSFFEVMREALHDFFHNQTPKLDWIKNISLQYTHQTATP